MSKASYTLYIIITTLILAGCQGESKYYSRLHALDSVLVQSPDSVYKVLVAEEKEAQQQSRSDRMYYELLRADAQNKAYIDFTTDSVMKKVADYYDHHGTANQQMRAHYLLGCTYRDLGDAPRALESYLTANDKSDTLSVDCDYHILMVIHSQMADIFSSQLLYDQELEETKRAEYYAWKDKDTISAMIQREAYTKYYLLHDSINEGIRLGLDNYNTYMKFGLETEAKLSCGEIVNAFLKLNDYSNAGKFLKLYEESFNKLDTKDHLVSGDAAYWLFNGYIHLNQGNINAAEDCFRKSLLGCRHFSPCYAPTYHGLSKIFIKKQLNDSIEKYTNLYAEAKDTEYDRETTNACIQTKQLYNYIVEKNIAEQEKAKNEKQKYIIILLASIMIIGVILFLHVRYRIRKKHEIEIEEMKFMHQKSLNKLHLLEEELLASKLNTAEVDSERANMIQEIQTLKRKIAGYENILASQEARSKGIELKDSYIVQRMKESLIHINQVISENDWDTLTSTVETIHPNFHMIMNRYSSLNDREYKICLLVKCGFSPKAIDVLLDLPHGTSSTMRQRLHKKVFNEEGKACDFDKKVARIP